MSKEQKVETIKNNKGEILAMIIPAGFHSEGINFFSPEDFPQQVGLMSHKAGKIIEAHVHNAIKREIYLTQEVLIIRKGRLRINFYDSGKKYFDSRILNAGDVISISGIDGHGFEVLDDLEMIEVKQGPYLGENDKVRFKGIEKK